jgi:hypothetical protein
MSPRHNLPELPSGVYRHYKGHLYQVLGYGHDANTLGGETTYDDTVIGTHSTEACGWLPLDERMVVVYIGLEMTDAQLGPRLAVRTADDFHAIVHLSGSKRGTKCEHVGEGSTWCPDAESAVAKRFTYLGPERT